MVFALLFACTTVGPKEADSGDSAPVPSDDADGDGYDASVDDCDDGNAEINPGADEHCDGIDNDCDGEVDDLVVDPITLYRDVDDDGYGDDDHTYPGCTVIEGYTTQGGDCDDSNPVINPGAVESECSLSDFNCDGLVTGVDADADGVAACEDCNDGDASISPAADELCNGIDDDCDDEIDEGPGVDAIFVDADGDGYGESTTATTGCASEGYSSVGGDCDDTDSSVSPGAAEVCDRVDNDCDLSIDDGVLGTASACPGEDCAAVIADNPSAASGEYYLTLGLSYCDMSTGGGGWTLMADDLVIDAATSSGSEINFGLLRWSEMWIAYGTGALSAGCAYPDDLATCVALGALIGSEGLGLMSPSLDVCDAAYVDYSAAYTISGADIFLSRAEAREAFEIGTAEALAGCNTSDNSGSATVDVYIRR
ncbi:MAG: hypothetical protein FJ090_06640 [Deltaproteobacteria bacterium]|nr:hypothetical protein [Deltaproteobacteria bacterium]